MGLRRSSRFSGRGSRHFSIGSFPGHVESMIKTLLVQRNTVTETTVHGNAVYLPAAAVPIYLHALVCFRTAKLAGAETEQWELTPSWGFEWSTF